MSPRNLFLLLLLLATTTVHAATRNLALVTAAASEQKRIALVIGNSDYQEVPKLANPENDARAMAAILSKLGFAVTEVTNATQKEMNRAIAGFGASLTPDTAALFYFAGHGLQVKGKNYLVPVDAQISGEASIPAETVDVDTVLAQLNNSTLSIVVLDACRNNPFQKARSLGNGGLAQMDAPKGSFIAYATSPGKTASDGSGANGLYTQELLKQIQKEGLSLEEVFKRVRMNVAMATSDAQIPWESTSLTGNFYFNGKPELHAQPAIDPKELALWNKVKTSSRPADFEAYLNQYPNGQFAVAARSAKSALEEQQKLAMIKSQMDEDKQHRLEEKQKMEAELLKERQRMDAEKAALEQQKKEAAEREQRLKIESQVKQEQLERMEKLLSQNGNKNGDAPSRKSEAPAKPASIPAF